jgi:hypothetical protein
MSFFYLSLKYISIVSSSVCTLKHSLYVIQKRLSILKCYGCTLSFNIQGHIFALNKILHSEHDP